MIIQDSFLFREEDGSSVVNLGAQNENIGLVAGKKIRIRVLIDSSSTTNGQFQVDYRKNSGTWTKIT